MARLTTERLILRAWRDEDLLAFAALNADPQVMAFLGERLSRRQSDALAERIRRHLDREGWGLWAVEAPDTAPFIGFVGLSVSTFGARFTPCVEVGWRLAHGQWGKGYATEAARAAVAYGFGTLGLPALVAFTYRGNWRSRAVMERLGMTRDPADDFAHPVLDEAHPLRDHVLYRIGNPAL